MNGGDVANDIEENSAHGWTDADMLTASADELLHSSLAQAHRQKTGAASTPTPERTKNRNVAICLYKQITKRLQKKKRNDGITEQERTLLQQLSKCKPKTPCASAACPKCTFALREAVTTLHHDLRSHGIKLDGCLTIIGNETIPAAARQKERKTALGAIEEFIQDLNQAFDDAGITTVIGAIDITWQESRDQEFLPHARPHVHALVFSSQISQGRRSLNKRFRSSNLVSRPIQLDAYDGNDQWLRYSLKYPNQRTIRARNDEGNWLPAHYKAPTVEQQLRQAEILDEMGWGKRLFLRGFEIQKVSGAFRLVLTEYAPASRARHR